MFWLGEGLRRRKEYVKDGGRGVVKGGIKSEK